MDYETKERLKALRENMKSYGYIDGVEELESIFPELRESEDERIRKKLIGIFTNQSLCDVYNLKSEDVLAYLEKQKEQKPDSLTKYVYSKEDEKFIQDCANILIANDYATSAERLLSMFKQNSTWSKEDEKIRKDLIYDIARLPIQGVLTHRPTSEYIAYLEKQEQKPAWSEEDEKILADTIFKLAGFMGNEKNIDFLKSLRPSWKPSELEKGALRTAIHILTDERNFPRAAAQLQNILNAFDGKESRKDWKPSKEQMEELWNVISYIEQPGSNFLGVPALLESLYEDLQKL